MAKTVSDKAREMAAKAHEEIERGAELLGATGVSPEIEREVDRQLLRYTVGREIFCPVTGKVLDMRRAVMWSSTTGTTIVMDSEAWDERSPAFLAALESQQAAAKLPASVTWSVLDGRVLFPTRRPRKRAVR